MPAEISADPIEMRCPIVELRQYTLHAGQRDALVALFDREFVEAQEAVGMRVIGQFRDLDDPDRFVWLRGYASMPARAAALAAFYDGPVWRAHRDAANATMIDSDDVLLLRPATRQAMPIERWRRADATAMAHAGSLLAVVFALSSGANWSGAYPPARALARRLTRALEPAGARYAGCYVTEASANTFPRLPVRAGVSVFVWLARFDQREVGDRLTASLGTPPCLDFERIAIEASLPLLAPPQVLRLAPTARSRF
jgi:NIPSNAP